MVEVSCNLGLVLPTQNRRDLESALTEYFQQSRKSTKLLLKTIVNAACQKSRIPLDIPKQLSVSTVDFDKDSKWNRSLKIVAALQSQLQKPDVQPITLGICANRINDDPGFAGIDLHGEALKTCEKHAVLLIGQRPGPGGTCQFLIRNSAGPKWCPPGVPAKDCEGGQVWLDAEPFAENIYASFSLNPTSPPSK